MNHSLFSAFKAVCRREADRMLARRLYYGVCLILPLFALFFMSTIFNNGQMENIPIGVVDMDQTASSRTIVRNVAAVPTFHVTRHFANQAEARDATCRKEIYGYLVIPTNFESSMMDGKETSLQYYYHYALLSVGSEVMGAFENVLTPLSTTPVIMEATSLGMGPQQIMSFLMPTTQVNSPLFNPDLDYSVYLSNPFFFVLLQVIILLTSVYIVGIEVKEKSAGNWLRTADGNILIAVLGKFFPYTVIFTLVAVFGNFVQFGMMHIPFNCGFLPLNINAFLLIMASQALGLFVYALFPVMGIIISIVSMIGSLGATLCGMTFPAPQMFPVIHYTSYLLPIRHFVLINQNLLYGDFGFSYTWINYAILLLFLLPALLILPRLKHVINHHTYENWQ